MKPGQLPTLSEYLLYKASKYLIYPHPSHKRRTKTTVKDLELFDKSLGEIVEGRRTFDSHPGSKIKNEPVYLDDVYCRQSLRAVPEMVRVTLKLRSLSLPETNSEWVVYLREAAKCLILGLSQATVTLARSAMETCLREVHAKVRGNTANTQHGPKLDRLITNLASHFNSSKGTAGLSPEVALWAREVQGVGNDVVHGRVIAADEAMKVYEAARLVILSVAGG